MLAHLPVSKPHDALDHINQCLVSLVPSPDTKPVKLHKAMLYSLLAPGKRLRPWLTILTASGFGYNGKSAVQAGCTLEMVHASSLILDDLPAMDDAHLRRGQPTVHKVFGEDIAILASIALMNRAFAIINSLDDVAPQTRLHMIGTMANVIGSEGLVGGQVEDLESNLKTSVQDIESLHYRKTGVLFEAAVEMGLALSNPQPEQADLMRVFAHELGLAFQLLDDFLDQESTVMMTGKDINQDHDKATFIQLMGKQEARKLLEQRIEKALFALESARLKPDSFKALQRLISQVFGSWYKA